MISKIVYKDNDDPELKQYQNKTDVEIITVPLDKEESTLEDLLKQSIFGQMIFYQRDFVFQH